MATATENWNPEALAHLIKPEEPAQSLAEFHIPGASFAPTQLTLEAGLPEDQWQKIGTSIMRINKASLFWIGDWLAYGRKTYGPVAAFALARQVTGMTKSNLYRSAYVAKRFAPERRHTALSFEHHYVLAAQAPELADKLLAEAEELGLTCTQVKKIAKAEGAHIGNRDEHARVTVHMYPETFAKLRSMAAEAGERVDWFVTHALEDWLRWRGHGDCLRSVPTPKERHAARDAAGLCTSCGGARDSEKKTCAQCLEYASIRGKWSRHERKRLPA